MTTNKSIFKINYTLQNDGIHPYVINYTVETLAVFTKMLVYIKVKVPSNENDQNFQKEVINTVVDVEKAFKGIQNNFIIAKVFENIIKSSNLEIKYPLRKVRKVNDVQLFIKICPISGNLSLHQ